jgi:hypothetical protein
MEGRYMFEKVGSALLAGMISIGGLVNKIDTWMDAPYEPGVTQITTQQSNVIKFALDPKEHIATKAGFDAYRAEQYLKNQKAQLIEKSYERYMNKKAKHRNKSFKVRSRSASPDSGIEDLSFYSKTIKTPLVR